MVASFRRIGEGIAPVWAALSPAPASRKCHRAQPWLRLVCAADSVNDAL